MTQTRKSPGEVDEIDDLRRRDVQTHDRRVWIALVALLAANLVVSILSLVRTWDAPSQRREAIEQLALIKARTEEGR